MNHNDNAGRSNGRRDVNLVPGKEPDYIELMLLEAHFEVLRRNPLPFGVRIRNFFALVQKVRGAE